MLKSIQRFLTLMLLVAGLGYLLFELLAYNQARALFPQGMKVAGLDVSGLSREEAIALLNEYYLAPLVLYHRQERIELMPQDVGFVLDAETMMHEAEMLRPQTGTAEYWQGYLEFVSGVTLEPVEIELRATHDRNALVERIQTIMAILDEPAREPQLLTAGNGEDTATFEMGEAGYATNLEQSLPAVEAALYRPVDREVHLTVEDQEAPRLNIDYLADSIEELLSGFDGFGSVFVLDLQTGDEVNINADVAMSGLSILKIAILLETYRALDFAPTLDQTKLISETAILSGDYSANLLLDVVAGQDNAYLGSDILTESMHRLGLVNTFIVTPYEEPSRAGKASLLTPANSRTDVNTRPDSAMQTTAEDIGTLLAMIYRCANGGGTLLAVYPDEITPQECEAILGILVGNVEGNLIRYGVPETVRVSHKHGWAGNTHGDAGVVFSPGGDYVIAEYLAQPLADWLVIDVSFPILREISRATYNYFNPDNPNTEDPAIRSEREAAARAAQAQSESGEVDTPESSP